MTQGFGIFRKAEHVAALRAYLHRLDLPPTRIMEVCGTHTVAIARHQLRQLMPPAISLTSGPGCPVCVTSATDIDRFIAAAHIQDVIITTFGDLLRVPGSHSSLQEEAAHGADIRVVYSPLDALEIAENNPARQVVFLGVGFETTAPLVGAAIMTAAQKDLRNFSVLSSHKVMPPALTALIDDPDINVQGFLCPGHVSVIIGAKAYIPIVSRFHIPCVISGFEPVDIFEGIVLLAKQIAKGAAAVEIAYKRAVTEEGNPKAMAVMAQVFTTVDVEWRGFGIIPGSGLAIREDFKHFDACRRFGIEVEASEEPPGCRCGAVLKGILEPGHCPLFAKVCKPSRPIGPCMVSSEGACAAAFRYHPV